MTVNKAILVGNLGQDPEIRSTGSGTPVATLRIATSDRRKDRDGNWTDHTEWHTVVVFGRQAENVGRFCRKGKQLFIEGRIQTRKWQDKEGRDRYNTEIVANDVRFLGGRGDGGGYGDSSGGEYGGGQSAAPATAGGGMGGGMGGGGLSTPPMHDGSGIDDDIPF
mgnify:CR=1 FL=1